MRDFKKKDAEKKERKDDDIKLKWGNVNFRDPFNLEGGEDDVISALFFESKCKSTKEEEPLTALYP